MWILRLNDMRDPQVGILTPVARAETKEGLLNFLEREKTESYKEEDKWAKCFKSEGPLAWYNEPVGPDDYHFVDVGTEKDWIRRSITEYRESVLPIPLVSVIVLHG